MGRLFPNGGNLGTARIPLTIWVMQGSVTLYRGNVLLTIVTLSTTPCHVTYVLLSQSFLSPDQVAVL